jgi:hypothetical protein
LLTVRPRTQVRVITATVQGIRLRLIDTPGLQPCASDTRYNSSIMVRGLRAFCAPHAIQLC